MKKGFTLVEILVVLIIIGILVAFILPNTLKAIDSANAKEVASTLRAIDTAIQVCYSDKRDWNACGDMTTLVSNRYLERDPGNSVFGVVYRIDNDPDMGMVSNKIEHFPSWPSLDGHN